MAARDSDQGTGGTLDLSWKRQHAGQLRGETVYPFARDPCARCAGVFEPKQFTKPVSTVLFDSPMFDANGEVRGSSRQRGYDTGLSPSNGGSFSRRSANVIVACESWMRRFVSS